METTRGRLSVQMEEMDKKSSCDGYKRGKR